MSEPTEKEVRQFVSAISIPSDPAPYMILRVHLYLEMQMRQMIKDIARHEGWSVDPNQSFVGMLNTIRAKRLLPCKLTDALQRLNKTRNDLAHHFDFTLTPEHVVFLAKPLAERDPTMLRDSELSEASPIKSLQKILIHLVTGVTMWRFVLGLRETAELRRILLDALVVRISMDEVRALDTSRVLSELSLLLRSDVDVRKFAGRVMLWFEGISERESLAMAKSPELRAFMVRLDAEFPYWFFFHEMRSEVLWGICFCLCRYARTKNGWEPNKEDFQRFLSAHFDALHELCVQRGIEELERDRVAAVGKYFGIPS